MSILQIIILSIIQGLAELLPVSSSAHVILAQRLMGLDPTTPEMTFFLVMLHTGTMFAVIVYFWKRWVQRFKDLARSKNFILGLIIATATTGVIGLGLKVFIEKIILERMYGFEKGEVEHLFGVLPLVATALFVSGILIVYTGLKKDRSNGAGTVTTKNALIIGATQGLCLPFRGLSRSGTTISTGLYLGLQRVFAEEFSFALAVLLTPPVIALEIHRLMKAQALNSATLAPLFMPSALGMVFSFIAGLVALKWLSGWLEKGRWQYFGYYCLVFSVVVGGFSFFAA